MAKATLICKALMLIGLLLFVLKAFLILCLVLHFSSTLECEFGKDTRSHTIAPSKSSTRNNKFISGSVASVTQRCSVCTVLAAATGLDKPSITKETKLITGSNRVCLCFPLGLSFCFALGMRFSFAFGNSFAFSFGLGFAFGLAG